MENSCRAAGCSIEHSTANRLNLPSAEAANAALHLICGHLHPALRLPDLPAFWLRDAITVLPAFSAFTGAYAVTPADGGRFLVCMGDALVRVSGDTPCGHANQNLG